MRYYNRHRLFESTNSEVVQLKQRFEATKLSADPKSDNNIAKQLEKIIQSSFEENIVRDKKVNEFGKHPEGKQLLKKVRKICETCFQNLESIRSLLADIHKSYGELDNDFENLSWLDEPQLLDWHTLYISCNYHAKLEEKLFDAINKWRKEVGDLAEELVDMMLKIGDIPYGVVTFVHVLRVINTERASPN